MDGSGWPPGSAAPYHRRVPEFWRQTGRVVLVSLACVGLVFVAALVAQLAGFSPPIAPPLIRMAPGAIRSSNVHRDRPDIVNPAALSFLASTRSGSSCPPGTVQKSCRIAVETRITVCPPHRSRRAVFPHRAPTLGV
jgi:hypothetical protein